MTRPLSEMTHTSSDRTDLVLSSGVSRIFICAFIRAAMLEELAARLLPLIVQR